MWAGLKSPGRAFEKVSASLARSLRYSLRFSVCPLSSFLLAHFLLAHSRRVSSLESRVSRLSFRACTCLVKFLVLPCLFFICQTGPCPRLLDLLFLGLSFFTYVLEATPSGIRRKPEYLPALIRHSQNAGMRAQYALLPLSSEAVQQAAGVIQCTSGSTVLRR